MLETVSRRFVVDLARKQPDGATWRLLRDVWLPPGEYVIEAVAYEARMERAAATRSPFLVSAAQHPIDRVQMVLVAEAVPSDPADADLVAGHPLRYGDVVLCPAVGQPPALPRSRPLVFSLTVPRGAVPASSIELWTHGRRASATAVQWQQEGHLLRSLAEIPLPPNAGGQLELRARVQADGRERTIRLPFTAGQ